MSKKFKNMSDNYLNTAMYKKNVLFIESSESFTAHISEPEENLLKSGEYVSAYLEIPVGVEYVPDYAYVETVFSANADRNIIGSCKVPVPGGYIRCNVFKN